MDLVKLLEILTKIIGSYLNLNDSFGNKKREEFNKFDIFTIFEALSTHKEFQDCIVELELHNHLETDQLSIDGRMDFAIILTNIIVIIVEAKKNLHGYPENPRKSLPRDSKSKSQPIIDSSPLLTDESENNGNTPLKDSDFIFEKIWDTVGVKREFIGHVLQVLSQMLYAFDLLKKVGILLPVFALLTDFRTWYIIQLSDDKSDFQITRLPDCEEGATEAVVYIIGVIKMYKKAMDQKKN